MRSSNTASSLQSRKDSFSEEDTCTPRKLHLTVPSKHTQTHLEETESVSVCENPQDQNTLGETNRGIIPAIWTKSRVVREKRYFLPHSLLPPPESLPSNHALAWWLDRRTSGCYSYRKLPFPVTPHVFCFFFCFFCVCLSVSPCCLCFSLYFSLCFLFLFYSPLYFSPLQSLPLPSESSGSTVQ